MRTTRSYRWLAERTENVLGLGMAMPSDEESPPPGANEPVPEEARTMSPEEYEEMELS